MFIKKPVLKTFKPFPPVFFYKFTSTIISKLSKTNRTQIFLLESGLKNVNSNSCNGFSKTALREICLVIQYVQEKTRKLKMLWMVRYCIYLIFVGVTFTLCTESFINEFYKYIPVCFSVCPEDSLTVISISLNFGTVYIYKL